MIRVVRHYPAIVEGDAGSGYSVFFPDLSGCTSGGETIQEAALNAGEALAGHVGLMLEGGDPLPEPSRLDDLARPVEPDVIEAARILVPLDLRSKAIRLNISLDENLVRDIDSAAAAGQSRSTFLAEAARRMLAERR